MALSIYSFGVYVCATVIVLLSLLAHSHGYGKPTILLEREYIVEAGGNFTVLCEGDEPLNWTWPEVNNVEDEEGFKIVISNAIPINRSRKYASRIFLQNATYLHTGYFSCFYREFDERHADKVYLYVRDENHLSASRDTVETVLITQYNDAVLPCRPTSPDVKVDLTLISGEKIENTTYDPKTGFRFFVSSLAADELYVCNFTREDSWYEVFVYLKVITNTASLAIPIIEEVSGGHTVVGEKLILECRVSTVTYVSFTWTTPNGPVNSDRIDISAQKKYLYEDIIAQNLTINSTTLSDSGIYYCNVSDNQNHHSGESISVRIYKKNEHFIYLTEENQVYKITATTGEHDVNWRINVNAHPPVNLFWVNNKGDVIPKGHSTDYFTNFSSTETLLVIKKIDRRDYGNYTLVAENSFEKKNLTVFLNVTEKPIVKLKISEFYIVNQEGEVTCTVAASPPADVILSVKPCENDYCEFEELATRKREENKFEVTYKASFKPIGSGYIKCFARNSLGNNTVNRTYTVTDVKDGFDIFDFDDTVNFDNRTNEVNIAKYENLRMTCGASVHSYSNEMMWLHEGKILKADSERVTLEKNNTDYSYRLILALRNITYQDGGNYTCIFKTKNGFANEKVMLIRVSEPSGAVINKPNADVHINKKLPQRVDFYCEVSGLPKPKIIWFKDDKEIRITDWIRISNSNQNLSILSTGPQDEGIYKCKAFNKLSTAARNFHLKFINSPVGWNQWLLLAIGVLVLFLILTSIFIFLKIRNEKKLQKELRIAGLANFEKGALENLNPELGIDDQAELLPYDKKWEFPIEKLKLGKQLGSGAFGVVMKGEAKGIVEGESTTTVAVKMVKKNAGYAYIKALASELKIMVHLGKHLNVVNLLGACTKNVAKRELLVIVEFCRYGNLQNYLLRHRDNFIDQVNPKTGHIDYTIGQYDLERSYSVSSTTSNSQSPYMKYAALSFSNSGGLSVPQDMVDYRGNDYNGTTAKTDITMVSMSPNSADEGVVLSNNSSIQPEWRSNYKGDYKGNVRPICTKDLLAWAFQVSRGMDYLASRRVLHGDLAARNILLADNNVVKICDFGLAKSMYNNDNYKKKGDGPLPVKWMAIESIRDKIFSTQSDVWSFGIVLWEFFSLARTPYPGMEADERLYNKLLDGYRMESPEYAPKEVYKMMLDCWHAKPLMRPSFTKLAERIGSMLEDTVRKHYIDLNDPYLVMNTQRLEEGHSDYLSMLSPPNFENLSSPHNYVNDLPPNEDTPGYLPMKSASIFSPRPEDDRVFDFDITTKNKRDKNSIEGTRNELAPMLSVHTDSDYEGSVCNSPVAPNSFSNPSYHLPPVVNKDNEKPEKDLVKSSDNYVNIPQSKNALKDNNPFLNIDKDFKEVNYVNNTSRDWESVRL